MSLPLAVAAILLADIAVIGIVAFVMSHARLLTPHAAQVELAIVSPSAPRVQATARPRAGSPRPLTVLRASA
ncbi:MAG: hypothetical protein QOI03_1876 [Solirubrobacteraceae bacterium]|jgi:hypothetical protein|nr:hypothetical protein [Solirubrobacteraceae bacterium]